MPRIVVGLPARNEADLIGDCLRALALQPDSAELGIVVLVNNSTDETAAIARALSPRLPCEIHVVEHHFEPGQAHAGAARRMAMQLACDRADDDGFVMTTDADGRVAPDWLEATLAAFEAGADVVCGRALVDAVEAANIPAHLQDDDVIECTYGARLDRIHDMLDPDPADPWPRHTESSGASIAVRKSAFLRAGGVPETPLGEDRALVQALRRIDALVRHAPEVTVTVSGRVIGRATGGMADTIRRRIEAQDPFVDDAMEPATDCARRATARRLLREAWEGASVLDQAAAALGLPLSDVAALIDGPYFGSAWALAEARSPILSVRRPVSRAELAVQMEEADRLLAACADMQYLNTAGEAA